MKRPLQRAAPNESQEERYKHKTMINSGKPWEEIFLSFYDFGNQYLISISHPVYSEIKNIIYESIGT